MSYPESLFGSVPGTCKSENQFSEWHLCIHKYRIVRQMHERIIIGIQEHIRIGDPVKEIDLVKGSP